MIIWTICQVCWFVQAAIARYHKLNDLNNRNLLSPSSGSQKLRLSLRRLTPSESRGRICFLPFPWLPLLCWQSLVFLTCRRISPIPVFISTQASACIHVWVQVSSFYTPATCTGLEAQSAELCPHLTTSATIPQIM